MNSLKKKISKGKDIIKSIRLDFQFRKELREVKKKSQIEITALDLEIVVQVI